MELLLALVAFLPEKSGSPECRFAHGFLLDRFVRDRSKSLCASLYGSSKELVVAYHGNMIGSPSSDLVLGLW